MHLISSAVSELVGQARSLIRAKVIERWSTYRADVFVKSFVETVKEERDYEISETDLNDLLNRLVDKDENSEALFDAYRRVTLARSREIGPRMIGILTATLILEERRPTAFEDSILDVAENLNDKELRGIIQVVQDWRDLANRGDAKISVKNGELACVVRSTNVQGKEGQDSSSGGAIIDALGAWGEKLRIYGLLTERISELPVAKKGSVSLSATQFGPDKLITTTLIFRAGYTNLVDLIERAIRALE